MDIAKTLSMNDANGGEGTLRGLVQHVPLTCGSFSTKANLYVGEHMPFQLLLGRLWQRGNYVSIDERMEGTYLLFKDPKNLEVRYEIMVGIEAPDPSWSFDPTIWSVPENLLITVPEDKNLSMSQSDKTPSQNFELVQIWNFAFQIGTTLNRTMAGVQKFVAFFLWSVLVLLKIMVQGLESISNKDKNTRTAENIKDESEGVFSPQNFQNPSPTNSEMTQLCSGRILNASIRENRSPIVLSSITCSFRDRTELEILDRVRGEIAYNRRAGFNLQSVIGCHSATELAPIYDSG